MQGVADSNPQLTDALALCRHLVGEGTVHAFLADHRHDVFPDELFSDLFPSGRGRPSVPADVIATVLVLQTLEGLSDRDALRMLRENIAWKVACGLSLTDEGFHPTVLTLWRNKLRDSDRPERIFDAVRSVVAETGVLKGKNRRALDSTLLDDAVATQDTVTQLISQIRRVQRLMPKAAAVPVDAVDYSSTSKPSIAWDDPEAKTALVTGLVNDAMAIIDALDGVELTTEQANAVGLLALVAGQDVEPGNDEGTWRIARKVAPNRVISTVDPESRHMHKSTSTYRDGYKAHIAVEPETGIVTAVRMTPADTPDGNVVSVLLADEQPGIDVLADGAYGSADTRHALREAQHNQIIKPPKLRTAVPDGFDRDDFVVDHKAAIVTCPAGNTAAITKTGAVIFTKFCNDCSLRDRCTAAASGRMLRIRPHDEELVAARKQWREDQTAIDVYRQFRPAVERSIAWLAAKGNRRLRFRGVESNNLWLSHRVAALNLRRLVNLGLGRKNEGWTLAMQ